MRARALALVLSFFLPATALAVTRTWTGKGGNVLWSNPANWSNGVPENGDDVTFPPPPFTPCEQWSGIADVESINDLTGLELHRIVAGCQNLILGGNRLLLGAGGLEVGGFVAMRHVT